MFVFLVFCVGGVGRQLDTKAMPYKSSKEKKIANQRGREISIASISRQSLGGA